jgi:hypothetical protein
VPKEGIDTIFVPLLGSRAAGAAIPSRSSSVVVGHSWRQGRLEALDLALLRPDLVAA